MRHLKADLVMCKLLTGEEMTIKAGSPVEVKSKKRIFCAGWGFAPFYKTVYSLVIGGIKAEMEERDFLSYVA